MLINWKGKCNNFLSRGGKICPLSKNLSPQNHLPLASSSHNRFRLLSLLNLPKKMILITILPFRQTIHVQSQRQNAYTVTPLHFLIVVIVISSYHLRHHQWSSQQQEEWKRSASAHNRPIFFNKQNFLITRYVPARKCDFNCKMCNKNTFFPLS